MPKNRIFLQKIPPLASALRIVAGELFHFPGGTAETGAVVALDHHKNQVTRNAKPIDDPSAGAGINMQHRQRQQYQHPVGQLRHAGLLHQRLQMCPV